MAYDREHFEKLFSTYSDKFGNSWCMNWRAYMKLKNEKTLDELAEIIEEYPEGIYLEAGCASGDFTEKIIDSVTAKGSCVGIDISNTAVEICRERFQKYSNVQFVTMALPKLPLNCSYDCIVCMDVFEYFDDAEQITCLRKFRKALKDDGKLVLQVPLPAVNEKSLIQMIRPEFGLNVIKSIAYSYG